MELSFQAVAVVSLLFLGVAFLYSSVGHGGASGYLAVLSFFAFAPTFMSTTALILNILVSATALIAFSKAKHLELGLTWPFVVTSVPAAFLGGVAPVSPRTYQLILAVVLLIAGLRFLLEIRSSKDESVLRIPSLLISLPVGALVGFVSGLVGVGGGIFLSPLILMMRWADAKRTAATSAGFILVNSISGVFGRVTAGTFAPGPLLPFLIAAFIGGLLGSHFGAVRYSGKTIRRLLGVVLLVASAKLFLAQI
ncbi:MAG: sulfite exporter TauE/SafE family protein [Bacteroidota bacterium]